jgi:cobalt/nickel transport system ATP-binding protein
MSDPIIRVSCVKHTYPDRTEVDICGLDFVVEKGQRVVVLGPNGCGKSTLLFHVLGLLEPREGQVTVFGVNPARHFNHIRERVGVLLQEVDEQIIAPTVWDDVSFSPRSYGYSRDEVDRMVERALDRVGIAHLRHKVCHYLSGGERRKVALAGALVLEPELLVLDEPFQELDPASRADLVGLLNQLHRLHGVTLVMATHDVNLVKAMADVVYVLAGRGEIVTQGTPEEVFRDPARLRRSNVEPPLLAELFQRLEDLGVPLGRPLAVDEAARAVVEWGRSGARIRGAVAGPPGAGARPAAAESAPAAPAAPAAEASGIRPVTGPVQPRLPLESTPASGEEP